MGKRKNVLDIVDDQKNGAIAFLKSLVEFKSVVGMPYRPVQEFVAKKFRAIGLEVDMWEPDVEELTSYKWHTVPMDYYPEGFKDRPVLVGKARGEGDGKSLIFNGHIEVVTADPEELWEHDPWSGEIADGKMYGRGVANSKGGLAAATMALSAIRQAGVKLKGDVILESVIDEEIGGTGTIAAILRGIKQMRE